MIFVIFCIITWVFWYYIIFFTSFSYENIFNLLVPGFKAMEFIYFGNDSNIVF